MARNTTTTIKIWSVRTCENYAVYEFEGPITKLMIEDGKLEAEMLSKAANDRCILEIAHNDKYDNLLNFKAYVYPPIKNHERKFWNKYAMSGQITFKSGKQWKGFSK
jgi:hypothetical protein